jgi:selenocysteine-specific elongation factor
MFVQFRLREAAALLPGERFIIRQFSPVVTIGGGVVAFNKPAPRIVDAGLHFDFLEKVSGHDRAVALKTLVAGSGWNGMTIAEAIARTGWSAAEITSLAAGTEEIDRIGERMLSKNLRKRLIELLRSCLDSFHKNNPLVPGMNKQELRGQVNEVAVEIFGSTLQEMARTKQIVVEGDLVHLPGRGVAMKDEEAESKKKIEEAFASAGLKVPALHEVIAGLKVDKVRAQKIVTLLLRDKVLTKISDELVFHHTALQALRGQIAAHKATTPKIDVAAFKELTGVSRKYAIPLLEYLDRERVTRRVGDAREIL